MSYCCCLGLGAVEMALSLLSEVGFCIVVCLGYNITYHIDALGSSESVLIGLKESLNSIPHPIAQNKVIRLQFSIKLKGALSQEFCCVQVNFVLKLCMDSFLLPHILSLTAFKLLLRISNGTVL